MRRAVMVPMSAVVSLLLTRSVVAVGPPHDLAAGITCADCHQPHLSFTSGGIELVTADPGTATTLVDTAQTWAEGDWVGGIVVFISGANVRQYREIIANTATSLVWSAPLPSPVMAGDAYRISRSTAYDVEATCQTCHNPTGMAASMPDVSLHTTAGGVVVGCGACHDPHNNEPNSGPGAGLIRETIRWPTANNPVTYPAPGNPLIVGVAPYNGLCETCHSQTAVHRNDAGGDHSHNAADLCLSCHRHAAGFSGFDHVGAGAVLPVAACMTCHARNGSDPIAGVHGAVCATCHLDPLGSGPLIEPYEATAPSGGDCATCHAQVAGQHQEVSHVATPGGGYVVIFADDDHDDAGWTGARPYFDVYVDCDRCHSPELNQAHARQCFACHPTPVASLGTWNGGCQQGSCHATFHAGSIDAHLPFSDPYDPTNDCAVCHGTSFGSVVQSRCMNCHATYGAGDTTAPVTTSNAQPSYIGPARIDFSITDGGKVGVGTTFYQLNGGPQLTGSSVLVSPPASHALAFWSVDQAGNVETPAKVASFTIVADTTPPTTVSNAVASYYQGALITLTATDASSLGVRVTHYSLDGGATQTGTRVSIPALGGTFSYALQFWSEDWSGNVEAPHTVAFTVTSGTGTLRLVWGDSDVSGPPPEPDASAYWYIRRGNASGPLVASGSGANPGWSGVDDVVVPVSPTPYFVDIWWWDTTYGWDDNTVFPNVYLSTPGQLVRLSY